MRIDWPVFLLSITLGLFLFAVDMLVDRFFLYDRLITLPFVGETKANELAMRLLILAILAVFGGIAGRLVYNLRDLKGQQSDTAKFLQQLIEAIPIPVFYKDEKIYILDATTGLRNL